jgi:GR25 family glycosyltransferase involved in LPS biosynthesis
MFETPILLITFNRPEHTRKVFEEIKKQKPKHVFVFQDGVRQGNDSDIEKCSDVRSLFMEPIGFECELETYFSTINLGCGLGPVTAINWFFEHVNEGLIFEDDAVPGQDFFKYAEELLQKYRSVEQVKAIGSIHLDSKKFDNASYYFSMMNRNLCAWATWKRSWNNFDYYLDNVSRSQVKKCLRSYKVSSKIVDYWCERLDEIHKDRLNESSWDMQFLFSIWLNKGVGVCPNENLSSNIGFDEAGTHTTNPESLLANRETKPILPLIHPTEIKVQKSADLNYDKLYFQPFEYGWSGIKRFPFRLNKKIKRFLGHTGKWF